MNYIIISILAFLSGFIIAALIFGRKTKENALILLLNDFKKTIDEYKNQNQTNAKEMQITAHQRVMKIRKPFFALFSRSHVDAMPREYAT